LPSPRNSNCRWSQWRCLFGDLARTWCSSVEHSAKRSIERGPCHCWPMPSPMPSGSISASSSHGIRSNIQPHRGRPTEEAAIRSLAESHETALQLVQADVQAKMAGGDRQHDGRAAPWLRPARATVRKPVPRETPYIYNNLTSNLL
jgi:hypothetical protein